MIILVIEDEYKIASFIKKGLEMEHYTTELSFDGDDGLKKISVNDYDLIILDILLPKKDGFEVAREVRKQKIATPILMLTAKETIEDKVKGLDAGADDYLVKPFAFEELLARIRSLLRREKQVKREVLKIDELTLNPASHEVKRGEKIINLSSKEYRILEYLMRHPNQVCTRTMLTEHIWGYNFDKQSNIIDVYLAYLRRKIDKNHSQKLIQTVRGIGYKIKKPEDNPKSKP